MGNVGFTGIMNQRHQEFFDEYSRSITDFVNDNEGKIAILGKLVKKDGEEDTNFDALPQPHIWNDEVRVKKFDEAKHDYEKGIPFLKTIAIITAIAAVIFAASGFLALGLFASIAGIALGVISIATGLMCAWKISSVKNYMNEAPHQNIARVQYIAREIICNTCVGDPDAGPAEDNKQLTDDQKKKLNEVLLKVCKNASVDPKINNQMLLAEFASELEQSGFLLKV